MKTDKKIPAPSRKNFGPLRLEALERRLLLSGIVNGIETDGDEYQVKLTGPGTIVDGSLENLTVANTTMNSILTVTLKTEDGQGSLAVAELNTGGANLGRLRVEGDLSGLQVGRIGQMKVETMGATAEASHLFNIAGSATKIIVSGQISDATVTVAGNLGTLFVGNRLDGASNISNSTFNIWGDLGYIRLKQSLTADSTISVHGDMQRCIVDKSIMSSNLEVDGNVQKINVGGGMRNGSSLAVSGDVNKFKVKKTVSDATIDIDGGLKSGKFGTDIQDSTFLCSSIDRLVIIDDLDNTKIGVTGDLLWLGANDSQNLKLRVGGALKQMKIRRDLDEALVAALNEIGKIRVGQDLYRSTIVGGIDIGADFTLGPDGGGDDTEWGNVVVDKIIIRGDMIDSSIAAGVSARGAYYGDGDDEPTADDIGTARINRIVVKGDIGSTNLPGETYAISAADGVDIILSRGISFTGAAGVVVQNF